MPSVSILVFVELALGLPGLLRMRCTDDVSILVFVELALGLCELSSYVTMFCFNPCFCGTRPWTDSVGSMSIYPAGFNPCFCGTRPWTVDGLRICLNDY